MKMIKIIFIIFMVGGISACNTAAKIKRALVSEPAPVEIVETTDQNGRILQQVTKIDPKTQTNLAIEQTRQECYAAQAKKYAAQANQSALMDANGAVGLAAVNALGAAFMAQAGVRDCVGSSNSFDVEIVRTQERHGTARSLLGGVLKYGAGAYAAGKLVDAVTANRGGVEVNGDNNQIRGTNTGRDGSATYSEQTAPFGGVPLNQVDGEPLQFASPDGETVEGENDLIKQAACNAVSGNWIIDEQRCSDGNGGTIDV